MGRARGMRRWGVAFGATVVVLALVGCVSPAGTDGDLIDNWPGFAEPLPWLPAAGDCHGAVLSSGAGAGEYRPIVCTETHLTETMYVGRFGAELASTNEPPTRDSPAIKAALAACVAGTSGPLGDDFRTGRVWLEVGIPGLKAWRGGARWYRCDLWEYEDDEDGGTSFRTARTASLRGTLGERGVLRFGCFEVIEVDDASVDWAATACDQPHNGEFAGIHVAPDVAMPASDSDIDRLLAQPCYAVAARYTGLKNDRTLVDRISISYSSPWKVEWERGNRAVQCLLVLAENVTKVMKGAGSAAFPIQ